MDDRKVIDYLFEIAKEQPKVGNSRICAGIVYKNRIITTGCNQYRTSLLQRKFPKNEHGVYLHAEIDAIQNFLKVYDVKSLKKTTLYVVRAKNKVPNKKEFIHGLAKPCKGCQKCIDSFNIKRVVFTTGD